MSLTAIYKSFLKNPSEAVLAPDAALNYISTLATFHDAAAIVKHITRQQYTLKKKKEFILSAFEGNGSVCLEVETTLEFVNGGGTYLPGLDNNFLADHTVTLPIVSFLYQPLVAETNPMRRYTLFNSTKAVKSARYAFTGTKALCSKVSTSLGLAARIGPLRTAKITSSSSRRASQLQAKAMKCIRKSRVM